jgi:hypothetical protein
MTKTKKKHYAEIFNYILRLQYFIGASSFCCGHKITQHNFSHLFNKRSVRKLFINHARHQFSTLNFRDMKGTIFCIANAITLEILEK